jgi:ATP-dependent Clp protease ATP-binding subunit ClpA
LANEILFGSLVDGGVVRVELVNNSLSFDFQVNVEAVSH